MKILIVDDEPINCEVARNFLEEVELVVDTAQDGAEALAMGLPAPIRRWLEAGPPA